VPDSNRLILLILLAAGCAGPSADVRREPAERPAPAAAARAGDGWGEDLLSASDAHPAPPPATEHPRASEEEDWEQELRPEPPLAPTPPRPAAGPTATQPRSPAGAAPQGAEEKPSEAAEAEPALGVWAGGGVMVLRGMRVQPAAGVALDVRLSRWIGWKGFFAAARLDSVFGSTPLGSGYVMWDALLSGGGRFGSEIFRLCPEIGFGARFLTITSRASDAAENPSPGFGFVAALGAEFRLARFMLLGLRAGGRYLQDPLSRAFGLSGVFDAGVWWVF